MSFGQQDDEYLTIELKELVHNKKKILNYTFVSDIIPLLINYELNAGFVFKLAVVPFAYDVSIGEVYTEFKPNEFQLRDHLEVPAYGISGNEEIAFKAADYKRIRNIIDQNDF